MQIKVLGVKAEEIFLEIFLRSMLNFSVGTVSHDNIFARTGRLNGWCIPHVHFPPEFASISRFATTFAVRRTDRIEYFSDVTTR